VAKPKMHAVEGSTDVLLSTEDALLRAAVICFSARGYSATSVNDITTQAGVAKGNVYNYFSGKDEILRRVVGGVLDDLLAAFDGIPDQQLDFSDQVHALLGQIVNVVGRNRAEVAILVQERRGLSREAFGDVLARSDEMVNKVTALLERGAERGAAHPVPYPRLMALGMIGMALWGYQWLWQPRTRLDAIARMYASVLLDGLCVGSTHNVLPEAPPPISRVSAENVDDASVTTRQALLKAALELFAAKGYDNTSMSDLARRAKVTTGAFYSQFSNKLEILRYLDNHFLDRLLVSMDRALRQGAPAPETLAQLMTELISEVGDHQTELTVFLQEWWMFINSEFDDVRLKSLDIVGKFVETIQGGIEGGEFRPVPSARALATGLIGVCAFPFQWSEPEDRISAQTARMYADVVLNGLRPAAR
jgi:AcrR family transcriptional regulator